MIPTLAEDGRSVTVPIRQRCAESDHIPLHYFHVAIVGSGGYARASNRIKVRNPWGYTGPVGRSVVFVPYSMSLPEFMGIFSRLAYEE